MQLRKSIIEYLSFAVIFVSVLAKNEDYIGYKVYSVKLHNETQQEDLSKLKSDVIDFWRKPCVKYNVLGKAMVPPSHVDWFEEKLTEIGVEKDVFIEDVHAYLSQKERQSIKSDQNSEDSEKTAFNFDTYYRYDVILDHLYDLVEIYKNSTDITLELVVHGHTEENRPLVYLKLFNGAAADKPVAVVEAAINPRDWITVPSALNVVNRLLEVENRSNLDDAIWIVIPVLNPDGYEYTHTNLRLWTKSRSLRSHLSFICPGVHLDRNFATDWLISDSSSSPCSHLYAGIDPVSEIETQMIRHLIEEYSPRLYISLQNSGKFVTYPWRFEKAASGLFRRHYLKGLNIIDVLEGYTLDSGAVAIGDRESGTSVDFARERRVFYTFVLGVDGEGNDGVIVPEESIKSIVEDVWRAVAVAGRELKIN